MLKAVRIKHISFIAFASIVCLISIATKSVACGCQDSNPSNDESNQQARQASKGKWLIGHGNTLAFQVTGTLVDQAGQPIPVATVSATLNVSPQRIPLKTVVDGRKFRFMVPANRNWYSLSIYAIDKAGDQHATRIVNTDQIRQVAREGLTLQAKRATRKLSVRATSEGEPVADASVMVRLSSGCRLTQKTNSLGIVEFRCLPELELYQITAWKGKQLIGGYSLRRRPVRDPDQDEHLVELSRTRSQRFVLLDEQRNRVPDVRFKLNVATPPPFHNFMDTDEIFVVETDSKGEASVEWFPDWPKAFLGIEVVGGQWIAKDSEQPELKNGAYRIRMQKPVARKRVTGRLKSSTLTSLGGFNIEIGSFQAEQENRLDRQRAFTNPDGTFSVDVLPDSTYCVYVKDVNWVSPMKDMILFDSETGIAATPELELLKGEPIRIVATQGPQRRPYPNLGITVESRLKFSWIENGEQRSGSLGNSRYVNTDANGVAETLLIEGPLEVSVNTPEWRFKTKSKVRIGEENTLEIHRPISEPIAVSGKLIPADNQSELKNAKVFVASFDGHTSGEQLEITADQNGQFEFETLAARVAIYAYSADGVSAVCRVVELPPKQIELSMLPTVEYRGRLLGENDQPLANQRVTAKVKIHDSYMGLENLPFPRRLEGNTLEAISDADGYYKLENVPVGVRLSLQAVPNSDEGRRNSIGSRFIQPGEQRPLDVSRFVSRSRAKLTIEDRFNSLLKNCELYDLRLLVITVNDEESLQFANEILGDYDNNRALLGYLPMILDMSDIAEGPLKQELLKKYKWPTPEPENLHFAALDGDGKEVTFTTINREKANAKTSAVQFIASNEPPSQDAKKEFAEALAEAKRTDRVVWAQHSQTRCGPCFRLSRWIDQHREILEKDFVFVKIDDVRDRGGIEIASKITGNRHFGIPFVAIFDPQGKVLIDGNGPLGNFGFPSSIEGALHLRRMILKSGKLITETELDQLVESLMNYSNR